VRSEQTVHEPSPTPVLGPLPVLRFLTFALPERAAVHRA
jgi:hypothetical protein